METTVFSLKEDFEIGESSSDSNCCFLEGSKRLQPLKSKKYYSKLSNGAFDISIEPLSSLWDFTALSPSVPSKTSIEEALRHKIQ